MPVFDLKKGAHAQELLDKKQDKLENQVNIKSINNESLLGEGNINTTTDLTNYYNKTETDSKFETIENHQSDMRDLQNDIITLGNIKQDKLENQVNIKSINNNSLLGSGNVDISLTPQFSQTEVNRVKTILANSAFGINKVTEDLEYFGNFSQYRVFNDLDKPSDNMVTDNLGNLLDIRIRENIHYAQNMWYDEDGNVIFENYQGKLTYKNNEVATKSDLAFNYSAGNAQFNGSGNVSIQNHKLTNLANGIEPTDAINLSQLTAATAPVVKWVSVGTRVNARTWSYPLVSAKRYRVTVFWGTSTQTFGGTEYEFTYAGTTTIIAHHQSNVGLLTLLAEILELRATNSGVNIQVFQTGNITGFGSITKLEEYIL